MTFHEVSQQGERRLQMTQSGPNSQCEDMAAEEPNHGKKKRVRPMFSARTRIVFQDKNPKVPGTQSFKRFEAYKKAATVGEAAVLGATTADLDFDWNHGYLQLQACCLRCV